MSLIDVSFYQAPNPSSKLCRAEEEEVKERAAAEGPRGRAEEEEGKMCCRSGAGIPSALQRPHRSRLSLKDAAWEGPALEQGDG